MNKILKFLEEDEHKLGVLSTVNQDNKPESAIVYYTHDTNLNIYFVTRAASRKYRNSVANPNTCFVISTESPAKTLQLSGTLDIVSDPHEQEELFPKLIKKATEKNVTPPISKMDKSEILFVKISTKWVRLTDFSDPSREAVYEEVIKD